MRIMNSRVSIAVWVGVALLLVGAAMAKESKDEETMTMKSLPVAVRKTAAVETKGATIIEITKEIDEGKTVYEIATKRKGRSRDIIIAADGTLLIAEEQLEMEELPPAVKTTIEKSAGKGRILLVEAVLMRGKFAYYEAQIRNGKKISELKVGRDGKLITEAK